MLNFWWRPLALVLGLLFLCLVLWMSSGPILALLALSLGLLLYLGHHLRQLSRLDRWMADTSRPVPECDGVWGEVLYRLQKLMRDHRHAQERSHANLEQMLHAARLLPDGVVILDEQNRINWLNQAASRLLGLHSSRDLGQFITYLLRNAQFSAWLTAPPGMPISMASPTAADRTLSLQLVPLPHAQKMLLATDITDHVRVDAMRRDFVANVSHELRTPITVIVGFLEAFADMEQPDPKQFKHHLGLMIEQSERIRRLVDDLLALARLEADTEMKDEVVDIPALAGSLLHEAETLSQGRHRLELVTECLSRLRGAQQELHSALGNLVSNAVRYTPAGGRITLRWAANASGGAEFSVTDTGEGIEPQHLPRLTERFYRVDRGRSRASGGTGLGLAIVKHVLQRHQARLRIESTVGKGSTFTAVFPAERIIPAQARPAQPAGDRQAAA